MENYLPHHPSKLPDDLRTYAREMRSQMTDAEALLGKLLRNRRIANAKFRRQHPMGRYILDFYCDEKMLAIELDGGQHMDAADYDERRDNWFKSQGVRTLRFWNNQVLAETESMMEVIYGMLVRVESECAPVAGSLTCSPHVRLQADIVPQARRVRHETPAPPPDLSPACGRGKPKAPAKFVDNPRSACGRREKNRDTE